MEGQPDDELVIQAQKGDAESFMLLARRYQQRIYQTIYAMTKNHQDADDLAQETFLQVFRAMASFKRRSGFYTWIYRIAVNLTLNFLKKKHHEKTGLAQEERTLPEISGRPVSAPEKKFLNNELMDRLAGAIDALPVPHKMAFILVEMQGFSHGQAAKVLKCSENTVSWRMHRARKMLQEKLRHDLKEDEGDEVS